MANKIHDAFDSIRADSQLRDGTKQFLSEKRAEKAPPRRLAASGILAALCALVLIASGAGVYWIQAPVSYVSIDVNPSIELALNRLDRVVRVMAFSAESEQIVNSLPLKGKKYTDAVRMIVESSAMENYLSPDAELIFTVAAEDSREDELQTGIEHCHSAGGHNCQSVVADTGLVSEAHENGLSLGKYYAYLQMAAYDDTITVDDCRDMNMSEMMRCIRKHGNDGQNGHGKHHRYGNSGNTDDGADDNSADDSSADIETDATTDTNAETETEMTSHHGGQCHNPNHE